MKEAALIVMAKEPVIGETKTRLSPPLSPEQATALHEALLLDTLALCAQVERADLALAATPPDACSYFERISPMDTMILPAACEDIGGYLSQVLGEVLEMSFRKALAINSDGPTLPLNYIDQAIQLLEDSDLVLGPGEDGGYYLVGLKAPCPALFKGIEWSTAQVLKQTLAIASDVGLSTALLPSWYDIDTMADVERLQAELSTLPPGILTHTCRFFTHFKPILHP